MCIKPPTIWHQTVLFPLFFIISSKEPCLCHQNTGSWSCRKKEFKDGCESSWYLGLYWKMKSLKKSKVCAWELTSGTLESELPQGFNLKPFCVKRDEYLINGMRFHREQVESSQSLGLFHPHNSWESFLPSLVITRTVMVQRGVIFTMLMCI